MMRLHVPMLFALFSLPLPLALHAQKPPTVVLGECSVPDAGPSVYPRCGNLLPAGWRAYSTPDSIKSLLRTLKEIKTRKNPRQFTRLTKLACRYQNGRTVEIAERLNRPVAMDSFPTRGTGGRDLVVSFIVVDRHENCDDVMYGTVGEETNTRELAHFISVTAPPYEAGSSLVGRWTSWTVTYVPQDAKQIRIDSVGGGVYRKCVHEHPDAWNEFNWFMSCASNLRINNFVARTTPGALRTDAALFQLSEPESRYTTLAATGWNPYTEPVWGRCGNLGCCASEL